MTVSIRLTGGRQLRARLKAMGDTKLILREVGLASVAEAKRLVPRRTANLARTIRLASVTDTSVTIAAGGQNNVGYAAAVEFGTKRRVIVPRKAKVLAWGGARTLGGRLRKGAKPTNFARRVNHPGTRAQPYLLPGLVAGLRRLGLDAIVAAWNKGA